ncbi:unnamed protein product [Triticum turgidum subsp. durum]|uniref:mRNA-decapping enzyme-like protein n=1 Tax=Triticum turgidum subsp. durum TaxID=4567 RepID=A0A9R1AJ20_TRITD|nr:unnamed protein product [Triticum turgidum subsp. durum]
MPPPPPHPNGGKVTPNLAMDAEGTRLLNLTVLQRLDPAVEDILITAAHVTLYDFNIDLNQWECEAVASLFGRILNAYAKVPPKPKVPSIKSEFEELEAVPTSSAIDGPSSTAVVSDTPDESFASYFSGVANVGNVPTAPKTGRAHPPAESVASSHVPMIISSAAPTHQMSASSAPPLPLHTNPHAGRSTDLVTPAFFVPPSSSSTSLVQPVSSLMPTAPPLHPTSTSSQRPPYGTPLLQPFPPPTPPASLTPAHNDGPVISRDKVKDALLRLVQSDEFIDLIYRELLNAS